MTHYYFIQTRWTQKDRWTEASTIFATERAAQAAAAARKAAGYASEELRIRKCYTPQKKVPI